ncbi:acyltransferase domain-containing protein [Nocardiopsis ganjiahuensis]|uniref:acyltransferase domain-containing protein n=1 Tax=Nocardiopsis ganjiahuensis TaxID=239984 RepID=UPI0003464D1C|nr:acyltransferase domain-containing protein [Nocardiopsis ganjiahuensis]
MDSVRVVERFGLDAEAGEWLRACEELPEPGVELKVPTGSAAAEVLDMFVLDGADRAELEALWPGSGTAQGEWPQELWYLVECMYRRLWADADLPVGVWRPWPSLVGAQDPRVRAASLWAFAAMVPEQLERHARRGIDRAVTVATLADVGVQVGRSRRMFGHLSVETAAWVAAQFRGRLFWVGGLQLEPALLGDQGPVNWYGAREAAALGAGFGLGDPVLRLHIPSGGLDPDSVQDALERARPFAREQLGSDPVVATCTSWLLDPWWGRALGEESNIVRFQRRFTLVDDGSPGEADVFRFVFGMARVEPERAPRRTRLERAALERLESGAGLKVCTGWLPLP